MNVYLAAPYSMKYTIAERAKDLADAGINCTSTWVTEPHDPKIQMSELSPEYHKKYAIQDVRDVQRSDIFVFHTDPSKTIVRGGRHVEYGIFVGLRLARGSEDPIFVVGEDHENIFHYLPNVRHFATWEETLMALMIADQSGEYDLPF
jgi:hypothetical protein